MAAKSATLRETNRIQPVLRMIVVALDVYVRRLNAVRRVEEDAIRTYPKDRRHTYKVAPLLLQDNQLLASLHASATPSIY
jgi:hypothetical protein